MSIIGSPYMKLVEQLCWCKNPLDLKARFIEADLEWYWECSKCGTEYELIVDKETHESRAYRQGIDNESL